MSRNGSGTYSLPAGNPVVTGTTISSTWANNTMNDIASALTDSVAADGQTPMTGNLNLNTNKIVNLADPTLVQDAATKNYSDNTFLAKASNLSDVANATTARTNISAAKSGANSDITSLTGLTTPLSQAQGGTGASSFTANNVLLGNGTSAFQTVAPSTAGNVLTSNGTTWTSSTITQSVKAWVNFDGTTSPITIRASLNVSSITDNGTGDYTVNFTTAMPDANYSAVYGSGEGVATSGLRVAASSGNTTTTTRIAIRNLSNLLQDAEVVCVSVFSS